MGEVECLIAGGLHRMLSTLGCELVCALGDFGAAQGCFPLCPSQDMDIEIA